jgi:hypothetical protein
MQQREVNAERQDLSNFGEMSARLAFLVRRFHAQVERQRRADEQLIAGLERVAHDPRVRQIVREICKETST